MLICRDRFLWFEIHCVDDDVVAPVLGLILPAAHPRSIFEAPRQSVRRV